MDSRGEEIVQPTCTLSGEQHPPRPVIENVQPEIDGGRFAVKRILNDCVSVSADIHADGHDILAAVLLHRSEKSGQWHESPMRLLGNDRWQGAFVVSELGSWEYTIEAWIDHFATWKRGVLKKIAAGQDVALEFVTGAEFIDSAASRAPDDDASLLRSWADSLRNTAFNLQTKTDLVTDTKFNAVMSRYPDRRAAARYDKSLLVTVDPERARFSSWYELFPRSTSSEPGRHGTFKDCEEKLSYVADMGFDVLYLPPIHPIGRTNRKGKNNSVTAGPDDAGSPWAIGSAEGGHKSIHPQLGTLEDFQRLVLRAREKGIEIALDIAFQCSPDHPWIEEHPAWFKHRPDGSIQYAENPPKKYQDIVPLDFETSDWKALYQELLSVVMFWIEQGVRIFRVDNPHTKPYSFWEWMIREVKRAYPEVIFLSEAFTRPKVMNRLAKIGFSQSYTYFTWRYTAAEVQEYMTELNSAPVSDYFRPNLWPNTPDILPDHLQIGGRPAFQMRLILAATLGSNYGIYGPAFELCENAPLGPGKEEYLSSEKYEIRHWDLRRPGSLSSLIPRINQIRRENSSLQSNHNLVFRKCTNDQLLAYTKHTDDFSNIILAILNLDLNHTQSGFVQLPVEELGIDTSRPFQVHDLLTARRYLWNGTNNYVEINPQIMPAHVFRLRRFMHTEKDFDYYF